MSAHGKSDVKGCHQISETAEHRLNCNGTYNDVIIDPVVHPKGFGVEKVYVGMPKFGLVWFSEVSRRTLNQNRTCGRQKGEPRTRTERTGFGRFSSGSTRVRTFELRKKKKSFDWNTLLQDICTK